MYLSKKYWLLILLAFLIALLFSVPRLIQIGNRESNILMNNDLLAHWLFLFISSFLNTLLFLLFNHKILDAWEARQSSLGLLFVKLIFFNSLLGILVSFTLDFLYFNNANIYPNFIHRMARSFAFIRTGLQGIVAILITLVLFLIKRSERATLEGEKLKAESTNAQLMALKTQINPHFLYNALSALSSMIRSNRKLESINYLDQLAQYFRYTLEERKEEHHLVSLEKELEFLKTYNFLMKERFGEHLQFRVEIEPSILNSKIPPMTLQLLLENATKHNVISKNQPLEVLIEGKESGIKVKNVLQPYPYATENLGIGLNNLTQRYQLLGQAAIKIQQTATHFIVQLPIIP